MRRTEYDDKFTDIANRKRQRRWDHTYLELAMFWAQLKSKDPSTQVGAVLVSNDGHREYLGYNGFPRGVDDTPERYADRTIKYQLVVHAEMNAILKAGLDAKGGTLYTWPLFTCGECAKAVIQSGIIRVVAPALPNERWKASHDVAMLMYGEAAVEVEFYE
jgi:dCMP deaminase